MDVKWGVVGGGGDVTGTTQSKSQTLAIYYNHDTKFPLDFRLCIVFIFICQRIVLYACVLKTNPCQPNKTLTTKQT